MVMVTEDRLRATEEGVEEIGVAGGGANIFAIRVPNTLVELQYS